MAKVIIDIGHGGNDSGATANGLVEKDINLKVGKLLQSFLSKYDVDLSVTRDSDITLSSDARVELVNEHKPDLCVSIHHNAAASTAARGAEVIHAYYDQYDDKLANAILDNLAAAGMPKRRAFTKLNSRGDDWYFMIRRIWDKDTAAIIIEGGFLTNKQDVELLQKEGYLSTEAAAIGSAIVEYLGLKPKTGNWWDDAMKHIEDAGLIQNVHNGTDAVNWGEFATVLSRLLDKAKL